MPNYNKTFLIPNVRGEEEKIKLVIINQKNYPNKFVAHFDEILYFSPINSTIKISLEYSLNFLVTASN